VPFYSLTAPMRCMSQINMRVRPAVVLSLSLAICAPLSQNHPFNYNYYVYARCMFSSDQYRVISSLSAACDSVRVVLKFLLIAKHQLLAPNRYCDIAKYSLWKRFNLIKPSALQLNNLCVRGVLRHRSNFGDCGGAWTRVVFGVWASTGRLCNPHAASA
jgi:hypothetical protein